MKPPPTTTRRAPGDERGTERPGVGEGAERVNACGRREREVARPGAGREHQGVPGEDLARGEGRRSEGRIDVDDAAREPQLDLGVDPELRGAEPELVLALRAGEILLGEGRPLVGGAGLVADDDQPAVVALGSEGLRCAACRRGRRRRRGPCPAASGRRLLGDADRGHRTGLGGLEHGGVVGEAGAERDEAVRGRPRRRRGRARRSCRSRCRVSGRSGFCTWSSPFGWEPPGGGLRGVEAGGGRCCRVLPPLSCLGLDRGSDGASGARAAGCV